MSSAEIDKIVLQCIHKVAQIVVQSRLHTLPDTKLPSNIEFHLDMLELPVVKEQVDAEMKKDRGIQSVVQVMLWSCVAAAYAM